MVGLMVTSSKRAYSLPRSADPYLCRRHSKAGLTPSLWGSPGVQKFCLSPLSVWWVWSLILNVISPLLLSCWGFYFALGRVFLFFFFFFFYGLQHSPVDCCSAASCNFGVLAREDELTSCYSAI